MSYESNLKSKLDGILSGTSVFDGKHGIIVGYSGGADSSALLFLLHDFCINREIPLLAVHINHMIRGAEADRDEDHCRQICRRYNIGFRAVRADIPKIAETEKKGLEETARDFRYAVFSDILKSDERFMYVATAHNADDNIETMLFNLARGTGTEGLRGIPVVRPIDGGYVIRPLIGASKSEIVGYCREKSIEYIYDSTNSDTDYSRNYIRHEIVPKLTALNPRLSDAVLRASAALSVDADCLNRMSNDFIVKNCSRGAINLDEFEKLHQAVAVRVLRGVYRQSTEALLEAVHIEALMKLALTGRDGASLSLPGGIKAFISGRALYFSEQRKGVPEFCRELREGINDFPDLGFAVMIFCTGDCEKYKKDKESLKNIYKLSIHARLNSDKIKHILFVRSKRDGDAFVRGKITRKLKKLFCERKLTREERSSIPIFCDREGILFVPGFGIADRVSDGEKNLEIELYYN